jgi:cellulose biosynthesis protein BcsQ
MIAGLRVAIRKARRERAAVLANAKPRSAMGSTQARSRLLRFKEIARGYDCVFLDGPPRLGDITQSAAVAADLAVLPIQPGPFDLLGRRRDARASAPTGSTRSRR